MNQSFGFLGENHGNEQNKQAAETPKAGELASASGISETDFDRTGDFANSNMPPVNQM